MKINTKSIVRFAKKTGFIVLNVLCTVSLSLTCIAACIYIISLMGVDYDNLGLAPEAELGLLMGIFAPIWIGTYFLIRLIKKWFIRLNGANQGNVVIVSWLFSAFLFILMAIVPESEEPGALESLLVFGWTSLLSLSLSFSLWKRQLKKIAENTND